MPCHLLYAMPFTFLFLELSFPEETAHFQQRHRNDRLTAFHSVFAVKKNKNIHTKRLLRLY